MDDSADNKKDDDNDKKVVSPRYKNNKTYKFCVYSGNYPATLRGAMKARGNWVEVSQDEACD